MPDPNPIVYFQMATTPEGRAFFEALFDWTVSETGSIDPHGPGDFDVKGMFAPLEDGAAPSITPWVRVLDLWATFERAESLGAEVLQPILQKREGGAHTAIVRAPDGQQIVIVQA